MITRPLDLAARLAPPPRRLEYVFFVNVALIVVFFGLFGSRFVLAPGLRTDFLPAGAGARAGALPTATTLSVRASGQVLTGDGLKTPAELAVWLKAQAAAAHPVDGRKPVLLIVADREVSLGTLTPLLSLAARAGFSTTIFGAQEAPAQP